MKIVLAPQGFKGSLKAHEAALAMERGVKAFDRTIQTVVLPIADGGAGTVPALVRATNGKLIEEKVHGPLGEALTASWAAPAMARPLLSRWPRHQVCLWFPETK